MNNKQRAAAVMDFRYRVEVLINSIPHLDPSREISLVQTCLERSIAWLRQTVCDFGEDRVPADHKVSYLSGNDLKKDQPGKLHDLRNGLLTLCEDLYGYIKTEPFPLPTDGHEINRSLWHYTSAILALEEAIGWLNKEISKYPQPSKSTNQCTQRFYTFGQILDLLRQGNRVAREGWLGVNHFIFLVTADMIPAFFGDKEIVYKPYIGVMLFGKQFGPYVSDHDDILASDWVIV